MTVASGLYGRKAAVAAFAGAVAGVVLLIALSVFAIARLERAAASDDLQQLALYRAETAARPQVEAALSQLEAGASTMPGLVHGAGGAQAAADIQSAVKEMVESNGGEIRSAQVLPSTHVKGFEVINIQYDVSVPLSKLRDVAYAIETHTPYLFLDATDISAPINWDPENAVAKPMLEVRWVVSAYRLAGAK